MPGNLYRTVKATMQQEKSGQLGNRLNSNRIFTMKKASVNPAYVLLRKKIETFNL